MLSTIKLIGNNFFYSSNRSNIHKKGIIITHYSRNVSKASYNDHIKMLEKVYYPEKRDWNSESISKLLRSRKVHFKEENEFPINWNDEENLEYDDIDNEPKLKSNPIDKMNTYHFRSLYNHLQKQFINNILKNTNIKSDYPYMSDSAKQIYKRIYESNRKEKFFESYDLYIKWRDEHKNEEIPIELMEEMMTVCQRLRLVEFAEKLYFDINNAVKKKRFFPLLKVYNQYLDICARLKQVERATKVWNEIKSNPNLAPDEYSYCAICLLHRNSNMIEELYNTYLEAKKNRKLTSSVFSIVLSSNLSAERLLEITNELTKFKEIHPYNFSSVVIKIAECEGNKELDKLVPILMKNVRMDARCYEALIYYYGKRKHFKRAKKTFLQLVDSGHKPSSFGVSSFLNLLANMKMGENMIKITSHFLGIDFNHPIFNGDNIIEKIMDALKSDKVLINSSNVVNNITIKNVLSMDVKSLATLMSSLTKMKKEILTINLFTIVRKFNYKIINSVMYNCVVNALSRVGMMSIVPMIIDDMKSKGFNPCAITYTSFMKGYAMEGNLAKCREVFISMIENNITIDKGFLTLIMSAHCTKNSLTELLNLNDVLSQISETPLLKEIKEILKEKISKMQS